jgi:hypothetical protein
MPSVKDKKQTKRHASHRATVRKRRVHGLSARLEDVTFYGKKFKAEVEGQVTSATLTRTIEGASTLIFDVHDPERRLLRHRMLRGRVVVEVDNLKFELVAVTKSGSSLKLTFEDHIVAELRRITGARKVYRDKVTRAEFVLSQVREAEKRIPVYIMELHKEQPIAKPDEQVGTEVKIEEQRGGSGGIDPSANITVKGAPATPTQIRNIEAVLSVGASLGAPGIVLLSSIMCITQEATAQNLGYGDQPGYSGLFQQHTSWPGTATDINNAATNYFKNAPTYPGGAIEYAKDNPGAGPGQIAQAIQRSAYPSAYDQWRAEAERTLDAFSGGGVGFSGSISTTVAERYAFERKASENAWDSTGRLAEEVKWRRFVSSGVFYYAAEDDLIDRKPVIWIGVEDFPEGIHEVDFDYDHGKDVTEVTVRAHFEHWAAPPGTVVKLAEKWGVAGGKYLVTQIESSLFTEDVTITLRKPTKSLNEPAPETETMTGSFSGPMSSGGGSAAGSLGSIRLGQAWGGTQSIFEQFVHPFMKQHGLNPGSMKEQRPSNPSSDHDVDNTNAYATDYPTFNGEGAARALAKAMGFNGWQPNSYATFNINVGGKSFRVQILWGSGIDHGDHVHVGIRAN